MTNSNDSKVDLIWYNAARRHRGSINEIALRVGCHRNWVRLVLKGEYDDKKVMEAAAEILVGKESVHSEYRKRMMEMEAHMASLRPQNVIATTAVAS